MTAPLDPDDLSLPFRLWKLILADNAEAEFICRAVRQQMEFIHHMVMTLSLPLIFNAI